MRIQGPHDPRTNLQSATPRSGLSPTGASSDPGEAAETQSHRHAPVRVSDIPPEYLRTLEAELSDAGIDRTMLDAAGMRRAYVLLRNGLPLTRVAITHDLADVPPVLREAASLITEVRQLLDTGRLTAMDRSLLLTLADRLEGLFETSGVAGNALTDAIESWTTGTELRLLALLADGEAGATDVDMLSGAGRLLVSDAAIERMGGDVMALVNGFRDAASQLRSAVITGETGMPDTAAIQEAVARFETVIASVITAADTAAMPGNIVDLLPAVRDLFTRQLVILHTDILPFVSVHDSGGPAAQVRSSGMQFEWRLFSWYVSGGSPKRLRQIMQYDLKGVLLSFLSGLKERGKQAQRSSLQRIGQHVRALVDQISSEQLATLTGRSEPERPVFFELPLAGTPGSGHARMKLSGEPQAATADRPRELTLSLKVDTSVLGEVAATMRIAGDAISLELLLTRDEWVALGATREDEIREQIRGQGFTVGDITFRRFDQLHSTERRETGA